MEQLCLSVCFVLLYLTICHPSIVGSQVSPSETNSNNPPVLNDGNTENFQEQEQHVEVKQDVPLLNKRKRKQLAKENKRATTNTKAMQAKIFNEMRSMIIGVLTARHTYEVFLQIIERFTSTVEAQAALKSVHWFQNSINRYLTGPKSSNVKTDFDSMFDACISSDAGQLSATVGDSEVTHDSTYDTEFFHGARNLLVTFVQTTNAENIGKEFSRVTQLLTAV